MGWMVSVCVVVVAGTGAQKIEEGIRYRMATKNINQRKKASIYVYVYTTTHKTAAGKIKSRPKAFIIDVPA